MRILTSTILLAILSGCSPDPIPIPNATRDVPPVRVIPTHLEYINIAHRYAPTATEEKEREAQRTRDDAIEAIATRKQFARLYDQLLLDRGLSPDSVTAVGTTLHIGIWMCGRQFIHDFMNSSAAPSASACGFTKVECSNYFETNSQEL